MQTEYIYIYIYIYIYMVIGFIRQEMVVINGYTTLGIEPG
jgi:hypothetical protein